MARTRAPRILVDANPKKHPRKKPRRRIQITSVGVLDPQAVAKAGAGLFLDILLAQRRRQKCLSQGETTDQTTSELDPKDSG